MTSSRLVSLMQGSECVYTYSIFGLLFFQVQKEAWQGLCGREGAKAPNCGHLCGTHRSLTLVAETFVVHIDPLLLYICASDYVTRALVVPTGEMYLPTWNNKFTHIVVGLLLIVNSTMWKHKSSVTRKFVQVKHLSARKCRFKHSRSETDPIYGFKSAKEPDKTSQCLLAC